MRGGVPGSSSAATRVGAAGRLASGLTELGGGASAMTGTGGGGTGIPATTVSGGGVGEAAAIGGDPGNCGGGNGGRGFSGSGTALSCGICRLDSRDGGSAGCLTGRCPNSGVPCAILMAAGAGEDASGGDVAGCTAGVAATGGAVSPVGFAASDPVDFPDGAATVGGGAGGSPLIASEWVWVT